MTNQNNQSQAESLAIDILKLSRNTLMVHLRFLQPAFCALDFAADPETTLATDGSLLYYQFLHVLRLYQIQKELVMRDYLHMVLHCIYHHPFVGKGVDPDLWNLACDIAVEAVITELDLPDTRCPRTDGQDRILNLLKKELPILSAEAIYHYLKAMDWDLETIAALRQPFLADEHQLWYQLTEISSKEQGKPDDTQSENPDSKDSDPGEPESQNGKEEEESSDAPRPSQDLAAVKKQWEEISARVQTDLETTSRQWGEKTGSMLAALQLLNREKVDYRAFLRQFAVPGEEIRINDEEFDYIFYTYGLTLYENMPLVEPLEYQEVKRIRQFVIAVDTSASVRGELAEGFLRKTCQLLLQESTWFSVMELHIIQCDSNIQSDTQITSPEELENYLENLELRGFGGTDFRPVFSYVEQLQRAHRLANLKGLLYFTDGDGIYPDAPPPYKTAFLFLDRNQQIPTVPVWAIKAILDEQAIIEGTSYEY